MTQDSITQDKLDEIENLLCELQLSPKNRGDTLQTQLTTIAGGLNLSSDVRVKLIEAVNYASNPPEQNWIDSSVDSFCVFKLKVTIT